MDEQKTEDSLETNVKIYSIESLEGLFVEI